MMVSLMQLQLLTFLLTIFWIDIFSTRNISCIVPNGKIPIHIRSIMTRENEQESAEFSVMLEAAAEHVNNMDGILDDYQLCFRYDHAKGTQQALSVLYDYIFREPPILMIFGPPYSSVSTLLNPAVSQYNIVQVTTSTSSLLKDRSRYPYTVQIYPVADDINPGRVGIVRLMKWKKVAIVFQDNRYFRANMRNLIELLEEADITILTIEAISDKENPDQHILSLLKHDARVIILAFYDKLALSFACKAYQYGLYGSKYVMILPGWFLEAGELWHDFSAPCSIKDVFEVYDKSLYVHTIRTVDNIDSLDYNGLKPSLEQEQFLDSVNAYDIISMNIKRIYYDGLMLMALALNASIDDFAKLSPPRRLQDFTYKDIEMADVLNRNVRHMTFTGISGLMKTNGTRDRSGMRLYISQYTDKRRKLILYMNRDCDATWPDNNVTIQWKGGFIPVDGKTFRTTIIVISDTNLIVVFALTSIGVLTALIFLVFNIVNRNERSIKITSPALNTLIVSGCILIDTSIFVLGLDQSSFSDYAISIMCHLQFLFVFLGFTLAMGALFMKTYRVNSIFTNSRKGKRIVISDSDLIRWIMGMAVFDLIICIVWISLDQMSVSYLHLPPKRDLFEPHKEIYNVPTLRQCNSPFKTIFLSILGITKGVLLLFGVFLAWKTRNIAVRDVNDSKYIALSVYTIALVVVLLLPTLTVTSNEVNLQFILTGIAVVSATTVVLLLVFLPKVINFLKSRSNQMPTRITTMTQNTITTTNMTNGSNIGNTADYITLDQLLKQKENKLTKLRRRLSGYYI